MSASQVLNAPTYYTTLAPNDALPDPYCCNQYKPWKLIALNLFLKTFTKLVDARKSLLPQTHLIRYAPKTQDTWSVLPEMVALKDPLTLDISYSWSLGSAFAIEIQVWMHGTLYRDTHLYQPRNNSSVHLTTTYVRRTGESPVECGVGGQPYKTPHFHPWHPTPRVTLSRRAWVRRNCLRTGVGRFCSCLYKWGMISSAARECGKEEQTVDHVVLQWPIHRPPYELHGLTVLEDETIEWLLNTFHEI